MDATMMKAQTLNVLKIVIFIFWDFHLMMNYGFWIKKVWVLDFEENEDECEEQDCWILLIFMVFIDEDLLKLMVLLKI